ncbi:bifunctional transcriptional activator/DNA repair enzyme AdaA [Rhizobium binae]|uniref:bifunctional transcriptional activator/DNA repair enzyme AdaA n=1 Tax=Rhizobium binae TaxID=1138190 RepID=UPI001C8391FE|nr:trifunctional transcriptional activator/DNA repair protein Ada/methylated-DNA--[protein]-cysteine S-methyltransferase [Rhizobium binae]MBX4940000.1 bifunctional transcriptional activator/DNA repair protein Ada [Rhizobium binae]MBX4946519.1 bifunctional transcriptional activator/DNA repair protein Ada [Rhizobium binae]MBX4982414.1 bifunctional transcriptional activator/DNA repair protein Ada [Rhizobium binae]
MLFERPDDDTLYEALVARSADYEGQAYVCVKTTGVFCRLTCPARKPKRENTLFFDTIAACLHSGFRPCRRCRPLEQPGREPIVDTLLARLEDEPEVRWSEDELVRRGHEPSTVRRAFKRAFGVTFHDFVRYRRLGEAARQLAAGARVIDAQIDAGYESPSGFRAAFQRLVGKAPALSQSRELLFADRFDTPLGPMIAVADKTHLHLLEFHDRKALSAELEALQRRVRSSVAIGRTPVIDQIEAEIRDYFEGRLGVFRTPLALGGTPFEKHVWAKLMEIPVGETRTYGDLAREMERPEGVRAVGRANGANQLAIIVPCHRVLGADGSLTGYGGGLWRKQWLLRHEEKISTEAKTEETA